MNTHLTPNLRRVAAAALAACSLAGATLARADNHALIMTIDYVGVLPQGGGALPGIDEDGKLAVKIAEGMGVPGQNIRWLRNGDLTMAGMTGAIRDLTQNRLRDGDKVFLYYSGHGSQRVGSNGSKCTESMVTHDLKHYEDDQLRQTLDALAVRASQVVMFNDSCFAGGTATKDLSRSTDGSVSKFYEVEKAGSAADASYVCGTHVNKDFASRTLGAVARERPTQMLYVAASGDNEVSRASPVGSWATQAWAHCLSGARADRDRNGFVDGEELRQCSQSFINERFPKQQTVSLVGNRSLVMSFVGASASATAPVANPGRTLESLHASSDPNMRVGLSVAKPRLTIGRDLLDFTVSPDRDGYLYLLHVSTDGKFYVLFPNQLDKNNFVKAGTHRFPRQTWGIQAHGPAGTGYIMAYMSEGPKDFTKGFDLEGPFATGESNVETTRKLGVIALNGRYGASSVVAIEEVK